MPPSPADQIRAVLERLATLKMGGQEVRLTARRALAALDALEAEHADRIWLTRETIIEILEALDLSLHPELVALLDERIGEK